MLNDILNENSIDPVVESGKIVKEISGSTSNLSAKLKENFDCFKKFLENNPIVFTIRTIHKPQSFLGRGMREAEKVLLQKGIAPSRFLKPKVWRMHKHMYSFNILSVFMF